MPTYMNMMNKKVLLLLKSDTGNHSMIKIYEELLAQNVIADVCSISSKSNDLYDFDKKNIVHISQVSIDDYDALIVTRNIFDYPICTEKIINYRGVIFADNTTFYEGDDVFGDVVFTSGTNNYNILCKSRIELPVLAVGCLKSANIKNKKSRKKIVWIESGHFPFGSKGRNEIANTISSICKKLPDFEVVVKPRYLIKDCKSANHYNADHIYNYLIPISNSFSNLQLIDEPCNLSEIICDAHTVIHTYSSAFQEAVELNKSIINIGDYFTEETVDLRKNRYAKIREYIDRAGCTISKNEVVSILPSGFIVNNSFDGTPRTMDFTPAQKIVRCILESIEMRRRNLWVKNGYYSSETINYCMRTQTNVKEQREKGALLHAIAQTEYYLDDYHSFICIREKVLKGCFNTDCLGEALDEIIEKNYENYNRSIYNQAYLMKRLFEKGKFSQFDEKKLLCQEAYLYFSGMTFFQNGEKKKAMFFLNRYLQLVEKKQFAETLVDKPYYQNIAKNAIEIMCK